jgi:hypothetical protein
MYHYYKCANAKKHKTCDKKTVKKDYIENLVVSFTRQTALKDEVIERIAERVYNLQSAENTIVKALKQNLKEVESGINNMLNAIQMGVVTSSTKQRLEDLEKRKSEIEIAILNEEIEHPILTKEQIIFWISQFKDGNIDDEEYKRRIIDTFINSVYLYDDKIVITYNFKDGTRTISLEEVENSDLAQNASPENRLNIRLSGFFICFFMNVIFILFE